MLDLSEEFAVATEAASAAASAILSIYDSAAVHTKPDGSFVTDADYASDRIIRQALTAAFPADAILTAGGDVVGAASGGASYIT